MVEICPAIPKWQHSLPMSKGRMWLLAVCLSPPHGGSALSQVSRRNILIALVLFPGCLSVQRTAALPPQPPVAPRALVFVIDGAGGFQAASKSLQQTVAEQGIPLQVEVVQWSHGYMRILAD